MRVTSLQPEFVEMIPEQLEPAVLYVSMNYGMAIHLCACGCGEKAITPLTPTDWRLTYDGETVSLWPSVGNWSFDCRSHYVIKKNRIRWAEGWSKSKVQANRDRQRRDKQRHFQDAPIPERGHEAKCKEEEPGVWRRLGIKLGLLR